ncbi:MAG: MaoC family dehydratase [Thermoleophilia bacterium]
MVAERSLIGASSAGETFEVAQDVAIKLAQAIGDPHPDYEAGLAVPPTFPTTFWSRLSIPALDEIDPARFLHGEQEYVYERPIRPGERLSCAARVVEVTEKETRLGRVTFLVVETEGRDEAGARVFTGRSTLILR